MTVEPTIFPVRRIITMNPEQPAATAVSVARDRIVDVGAVESLEGTVDHRFADAVVLPGLIDQHLHPVLGATTLVTDVIATEDWDLPGRMCRAAATEAQYRRRLAEAEGRWSIRRRGSSRGAITGCGTVRSTAGSSTASAGSAQSRSGSAAVTNGS